MQIGREGIKELKEKLRKEQGIKVIIPDLLAMGNAEDPFYAGGKTDTRRAKWFTKLWQQFKLGSDTHIRRIYYRIVSLANIKTDEGKVFQPTKNDYFLLGVSSKKAREMGLVPAEDFIDRRNPQPIVYPYEWPEEPDWEAEEEWELVWPEINTWLGLDWELPDYYLTGYEYVEDLQPNHIEIWIEKSDMNDILIPLCERYHINLVVGIGVQSISQAVRLLKKRVGYRPCRILYISDFDKAGEIMPMSVARQTEFWQYVYGMRDKDIRLTRILLTKDQVIQYNLPPEEVPESDKIGYTWTQEQAIGGKVELDALEAIHPGEFEKIVTEAIEKLRDDTLDDKVDEAEEEAKDVMKNAWDEAIEPYQDQLDQLGASIRKVTLKYEPKLKQLNDKMQAELAPFKPQAESLGHALKKAIEDLDVDLPELPEGEAEGEDEMDWLFDSSRDYLEQIKAYKAYKKGGKVNG